MTPRHSSLSMLIWVCSAFGPAIAALPPDKPVTAKQCRAVPLPDGGSTRMCRGPDGRWTQSDNESLAVPDKAEITYRGTWSGTTTPIARSKPRINLGGGLDIKRWLNSAANSATSALNSTLNNSAPAGVHQEGAMTLVAKFDGSSLTITSTGTGGWKTGIWSGVYTTGRCHVVSTDGTQVMDGACDRKGFSGAGADSGSGRSHYAGQFESSATSFVNIAERDAKRDALQRQCDDGKTQACVALDQK